MTTPTPIPHLDEPAQQLARIRRLERDLESERANVARERRSNASLALELFEARELAKALAAEVEQLRAAQTVTGLPGGQPIRNVLAAAETAVTRETAIAHLSAGGVVESEHGDQTRKSPTNGHYEHRSKSRVYDDYGAWFVVSNLDWMTSTPGFYRLLPITPQENGAAG